MDRRSFVGVLASASIVTTPATPASVPAVSPSAPHATPTVSVASPAAPVAGPLGARGAAVGPHWTGASALRGGKGYAPGPLGQIHYRCVGEGPGAAFLLIHQTPIGMVEYVDVQPALARAGRRSIVSDNPGYGSSDLPAGAVTMAQLADQLRALCDHVREPRVIVVGHHTGAAIAAAFAARHPALTAGVVLHGSPLFDASERAERLARPAAAFPLAADGSHLADVFRRIGAHAGVDAQSLSAINWATIGAYLAGADLPVYRAVFANDMAADVKAIRAPTLVLTDRDDALHANDQRVVKLRPDFTMQTFSEGRSFALMREPERWAQVLIDFSSRIGS
jgi:pimeloyl-ACP methyl ester carboxylesterase